MPKFPKIKPCHPRRAAVSVLLAAAAALAVWLLCAWVGYDLQERVGNVPLYTIVNDEYDRVLDLPEAGFTQKLPLKAGQPFYGVRFKFSTHGQNCKSGMTMVRVENAAGQEILYAAANFLNVRDDEFTEFVTNGAYTPEKDETLTVYIYNEVPWDAPIGLWVSTGQVGDMALAEGTTLQDATLAMQVVSDYSGDWPTQLAKGLAPLLSAAAFLAVLLVGLQAPLALVTACVGLALGLTFVRVTPALTAPDEYTHLAAAYELASRWSGQQAADENGYLLVRDGDAAHFGTKTGDVGIFAYKAQVLAARSEPGSTDELTVASEAKAGQGSGNYLAQAVGIRLARALGKNFYTMLCYGRTANLLLYLLLAVLAVLLAPGAMRGVFACVALLPMPLQLAGSLSPDAYVLGVAFCFTALCLRLRREPASGWQCALLVLLGGMVGPAKAIYLPLVLLCLLIPAENLTLPARPVITLRGFAVRSGRAVQAATLVLAGGLWLSANLYAVAYAARDLNPLLIPAAVAALLILIAVPVMLYRRVRGDKKKQKYFWLGLALVVLAAAAAAVWLLAHMGGGLDPDQLTMTYPNGDSIWTFSFGYICRNINATIKLLMRTIPEQGALWLQGLLGTTLGEPIVYRVDVSWLIGVGLVLALLAAALPALQERPPLGRRSAWGTAGILLLVLLSVLAAALNWTPINYRTLFGMQGRYLLPTLPLTLALCKNSKTVMLRHSAAHTAALSVSLLTLLTLLQGFSLYAVYTM